MEVAERAKRVRKDLHCLSIDMDTWEKVKGLSLREKRSVSSYIRWLIHKTHEGIKGKPLKITELS